MGKMEKIKNILFSVGKDSKTNMPLIIVLIVLVALAIILGVVKHSTAESQDVINMEDNLSENNSLETEENNDEIIIDETINVQEIEEEVEATDDQIQEAKYFIRVNYGQNVVTIYTRDSSGNFTNPVKAMVCSTGTATPTSGTYTIPGGTWDRWTWGKMVGDVWAQYYVRIKGSILFHSVPYTSQDKSTLEYWEYDKLGTTASAGCVRLTVEDAKWIYDNCAAGTQVEFYSDSNPGPLGKPTAQKISDEEEVRGWDPTDPDSRNPWRTYVKNQTDSSGTSSTTGSSGTTNVSGSSSTTDTSGSTGTTDTSDSTGTTDTSDSTGTTDTSDSTGTTDTPDSSETTDPDTSTIPNDEEENQSSQTDSDEEQNSTEQENSDTPTTPEDEDGSNEESNQN